MEVYSLKGKRHTKNGFTLAEILITLGIVGVIAAMTLPTLINNAAEKELKTAYKQAYADMANAVILTSSEQLFLPRNGTIFDWAPNVSNFITLSAKFKIQKSCLYDANPYGCWKQITTSQESDQVHAGCPSFIDASGRSWLNENMAIFVDVNGFKGPNIYGKDRWPLYLNDRLPGSAYGFNWTGYGPPNELNVPADRNTVNVSSCPSGNCPSRSWLDMQN